MKREEDAPSSALTSLVYALFLLDSCYYLVLVSSKLIASLLLFRLLLLRGYTQIRGDGRTGQGSSQQLSAASSQQGDGFDEVVLAPLFVAQVEGRRVRK